MTIDKDLIVRHLKAGLLKHSEIAKIAKCSVQTVGRVVRAHGLHRGQGVLYPWKPVETPDLAYVAGFYVTDGTIGKNYTSGKASTVSFSTKTPELADMLISCLTDMLLKPKKMMITQPPVESVKHKISIPYSTDVLRIACYSSRLARWLLDSCQGKERIPPYLYNAPTDQRLAFLAGVIDGDGTVGKRAGIRIRGVHGYLAELPKFGAAMGIRCTGPNVDRILPSGKNYLSVNVRRADLLALYNQSDRAFPICVHPVKLDRILHAKPSYKYRAPKKYLCPVCGEKTRSKSAKTCRACYLKSEQHLDHCRRIAPAGNRAANIARWGPKD